MPCKLCGNGELSLRSYQVTEATDFGDIIEIMDLCDDCMPVVRDAKNTLEFLERG